MKRTLAQLLTPIEDNHNLKWNHQWVIFRISFSLAFACLLGLAIFISYNPVAASSATNPADHIRIFQMIELDELAIEPGSNPRHVNDSTNQTFYEVNRNVEFVSSGNSPSKNELEAFDSDLEGIVPRESSGRDVEQSIDPIPQLTASVPTVPVTLVNITNTSSYSPPSPDPSGLAYISASNQLMISDSEVNEIPALFTGYNIFLTSLSGSLISTLTTYNPSASPPITFSDEPTGVAINPTNNHLFFTDDLGADFRGVYELNPGEDGDYNTADDEIYQFDTRILTPNGIDPEGVAFDGTRGNGHIFVVEGAGVGGAGGIEVYDIDLGPTGTLEEPNFVTHFDVEGLGFSDPEGIEFNPDNNHLYILDSTQDFIGETTIDGTLIRYLDLTPTLIVNPGGLTIAPPSAGGPGKNIYIVDRGVDNGQDPNENDGKLYEVSVPNTEPYVDAGSPQTITLPNNANLDGTVWDDGLPDPPGQVSTSWSKFSGPGQVDFNDSTAIDTSVSFSTDGTYVLRLTAHDGVLYNHDDVTITVEPASTVNQPPIVDAGPPQTITLPNSANLDGTVNDDGLPNPPGSVTTSWTKTSGPGQVTFDNAGAVDTIAHFSLPGDYTLNLSADDGALASSDTVTITVNTSSNLPPSVDAGTNQTIYLPNRAYLHGIVEDDGLPNPPGEVTTAWTKKSGPGPVTFTNPSALDTSASFANDGVYILRLTAVDGETSASDEITITIYPPLIADFQIWLPITSR